MKQFLFSTTAVLIVSLIGVSSAWSEEKPDFMDSEAVLKNMRTMLDQCSASQARNCMVSCDYGLKTLKNFVKLNPAGDPSIMKQR